MKRANGKSHKGPRFSYAGLDRVIHERARLSMLTSLMSHPAGLSFAELKTLCALTDGNLSRHLQVLESERLVASARTIERNRPLTRCRITPLGRKRYLQYVDVLEHVVHDATQAIKGHDRTTADPLPRRVFAS
ncbi:MAG TPA: transcriptional regulator [Steroidobacteraceae bacterium]|nr:transcriptional regulator [Steroidobacteraceae bacterium]